MINARPFQFSMSVFHQEKTLPEAGLGRFPPLGAESILGRKAAEMLPAFYSATPISSVTLEVLVFAPRKPSRS